MAQQDARITLYGPPLTPFTIKVVRALRWKGLRFELVEPTSPEDFRRWNPEKALLPVIDVDGTRVDDSAAILDLLDERFPEPSLTSSDPGLAREQRRLEQWVGETFSFYMLRWVRGRLPPASPPAVDDGPRGPMARHGILGEDGRIRAEFFDTRDGGPGPEFGRRVDDLEKMIGSREFFLGDALSRADLGVFGSLAGMFRNVYAGGRALLDEHPQLLAHTRRIDAATGSEFADA